MIPAGKGILAADERYPTIKKRFAAIDLASTEESRRNYRDMLFTVPGLNEYISEVTAFDETLRQRTNDGIPLAEALAKQVSFLSPKWIWEPRPSPLRRRKDHSGA